MSDEPENLIDDIFMKQVGVKYPFVRSGGVNEKYRIKFFPSVYCIGPDGNILTVPDDRMPSEQFLEQQLANVSLTPKMPADSRFDALRSMWEKRDHKRIADYLDKMLAQDNLDGELRTVYQGLREELDKRIARQKERIAELAKGPDFGASATALEKIAKDWSGLPPAVTAQEELARFAKDTAIAREITASKAYDKLLEKADMSKSSQRKKLAEDLQKFVKRYSGTVAAAKASELRSNLLTKGD